MKYICPICGYKDLDEPAYDKYGDGSYDICSCCKFQFGYDDDVEVEEGVFMEIPKTHIIYRLNWIKEGAPVFNTEYYPKKFQLNGKVKKEYLIEQLKNVNIDYYNIYK
ncbi:hypothetical protein H7F28_08655 [Brevibacterium sp. PAMC23299]|nr:hypothetical protein H7F28_08655 [Brevibacterium sp. PAMC23299]